MQFLSIFKDDLRPNRIIQDLSISLGESINPEKDLLFFDEIQECPRAFTSLKYFCEELPGLALCCAGSLLGVQLSDISFPVGKIDELSLFPMTFDEFLHALPEPLLIEEFDRINSFEPLSEIVHEKLWEAFKLYLVT